MVAEQSNLQRHEEAWLFLGGNLLVFGSNLSVVEAEQIIGSKSASQ